MRKLPDVKKVLADMNAHLQSRPDEKLIAGYQKAMKDYEETENPQAKIAADMIKKEIDRRGLDIETTD